MPSNRRFRVRGQGIERDGRKGDLLVEVRVDAPHDLSAEAKEAMDKFAAKAGLKW